MGDQQSFQHAQGPLSSLPAGDQPPSREHLQELRSATAEFNLIYTDNMTKKKELKHHFKKARSSAAAVPSGTGACDGWVTGLA